MENKTAIVEKIKRLLALGDGSRNNSEEEAKAAMLKAHELMAKYDITLDATECDEIKYIHLCCDSKWNMGFRKPLAVIIAKNFRCETYLESRGGRIIFFGHDTDATIAKEVFEYAYNFALSEGNKHYNRNYNMGLNTKGVFNSYIRGFLSGLKQSLDKQSTALMVVTPPDVKEQFEDFSKDFRKGSGGIRDTGFDASAYKAGITDGKTVLNGRKLEANN